MNWGLSIGGALLGLLVAGVLLVAGMAFRLVRRPPAAAQG